jgi:phosphoglucosamine mutase
LSARRKLFGTDGVRGVAGADLTAALARDLGRAAARFAAERVAGAPTVLIGRDTRESGPWLEAALADGVTEAGGDALIAGIVPTPAVAALASPAGADRGCVVSASHNPFRDNGIKFLGGDGRKLSDEDEGRIEELVGTGEGDGGGARRELDAAVDRYVAWLAASFADPGGRRHRIGVDCANGAAYVAAPRLLARLGVEHQAIGVEPDGRNINDGVGSTHMDALAALVAERGLDLGLAFDGDADRCLAVDRRRRLVNGDGILAVLALDLARRDALEPRTVVVTSMTNLGFHRLMREHGIAIETTEVGDRYVLERMLETGAILGGEQSGHIVHLGGHTTGDGLATALLLLGALARLEITMDDAAELVRPFPQRLVNVPADRSRLADADRVWEGVERAAAELGHDGRVVVRASGTEPVVRVMVEAADEETCIRTCDRLSRLVAEQIGE